MNPRKFALSVALFLFWNHYWLLFGDRYIADVFKESAGGDLLYFMCVCTEDERINAIESMKIITSDFTGLIECTLNEAVGLEPRHSFDPDEFDTHKAIVAIEVTHLLNPNFSSMHKGPCSS